MLAPNVQADTPDQNSEMNSNLDLQSNPDQNSNPDLNSSPVLTSSPSIQLSPVQFTQLLGSLNGKQLPEQGTFSKCSARFNGSRSHMKVNAFIATISIFKDIENINDDNALRGLPLLLEEHASIWWRGVQNTVSSWKEALELIRSTFAPRRPAYQIYKEVFSSFQAAHSSADVFISEKRALLAELPNLHPEAVQLDMIYGLLRLPLRTRIPREAVTTFSELIKRAREIEDLEKEIQGQRRQEDRFAVPYSRDRRRCTLCRRPGHLAIDCRLRKTDNSSSGSPRPPSAPATHQPKPFHRQEVRTPLQCYGCGKPGVVRSKCPDCSKASKTPVTKAAFCTVNAIPFGRQRPIVDVTIAGEEGHAFIDTGAKCCIASQSLYLLLAAKGTQFQQKKMQVALADGHPRVRDVLTTQLEVTLCGRHVPTTFVVLTEGKDNRTLLGVDFIEDAGIVLNLPQRAWHFIDAPEKLHDFPEEKPRGAPSNEGEKTSAVSLQVAEFINIPEPLSPIPETSGSGSLQAYLDDTDIGETIEVSSAKTSELDELFDRCFHTYETRMDIAVVEIELREDEAVAQQNQEQLQEQRKEYADQHRRLNPGYEKGDLVWVTTHTLSRRERRYTSKLAPKRDGPYVIRRRVGPNSYEIETRDAEPVCLGVYHASALRAYIGASQETTPDPVVPIRKRGRPRKPREDQTTEGQRKLPRRR